MGGMQALALRQALPRARRIGARHRDDPRLAAQAIAFNEVGRQAILDDPELRDGDYYDRGQPDARSRRRAHDRSHHVPVDESMHEKFGRRLRDRDGYAFEFVHEFEVETYLAYQGRSSSSASTRTRTCT